MRFAPSLTKRRKRSGNRFSQQIGVPNFAPETSKSVYRSPATKLPSSVVIHRGQLTHLSSGRYSLKGRSRIFVVLPYDRSGGDIRYSLFE